MNAEMDYRMMLSLLDLYQFGPMNAKATIISIVEIYWKNKISRGK